MRIGYLTPHTRLFGMHALAALNHCEVQAELIAHVFGRGNQCDCVSSHHGRQSVSRAERGRQQGEVGDIASGT